MDLSKIKNGQKIVLVAGLLLIIDIFLPWYGAFGFNINAFDSGSWRGSGRCAPLPLR